MKTQEIVFIDYHKATTTITHSLIPQVDHLKSYCFKQLISLLGFIDVPVVIFISSCISSSFLCSAGF
jgi:hypothetical protein